jgi:hypothetical protein
VDVKTQQQKKASLSKPQVTPLQAQLQQLQQQQYTQQSMQQLVEAAKAGTALLSLLPQAADTDSTAAPAAAGLSSSTVSYPSSSSGGGCAATSPAAAAAAEAAKRAAAGPFAALGRDTLLEVLCCLDHGSVAALGQTCRSLHEAVEDGTVWQVMMTKAFPRHSIKPSNMTGAWMVHSVNNPGPSVCQGVSR